MSREEIGEEILARYELVVGMEVHAQLNTESKLFCGCAVAFGGEPNTRTCPVCLGLPGVLPVLNQAAFSKAVRIAAAFGADVAESTEFDRKNYYYPDLPKNYQISQMYHNLGGGGGDRPGGALQLLRSGKSIRIHNLHLEEDAGKLSHINGAASEVDLNRTGTPLAEIVTEPDFRTVDEVDDYMETLTVLLRALDVCRCQMQEGNLRFEASISVRPLGQETLNPRCEIKNLNSYSGVRRAVAFERARQVALLEAGLTPRQETRLWDEGWNPKDASRFEDGVPAELKPELSAVLALLPDTKDGWKGRTAFMRSKEDAHDYRYFPEPDMPAFRVDPAELQRVANGLPELPGSRRQRYVDELGLAQKAAEVLARDYPLAAFFEAVIRHDVPPPEAANLVLNQVAQLLNERKVDVADCPVPAEYVAGLFQLTQGSEPLPKDLILKQVWPKVVKEQRSPAEVVERHGIQAVDEGAVRAAVDAAWAANAKAVAALRDGNKKARGAIVGAVMKATQGQASPQLINARISELLAQDPD